MKSVFYNPQCCKNARVVSYLGLGPEQMQRKTGKMRETKLKKENETTTKKKKMLNKNKNESMEIA